MICSQVNLAHTDAEAKSVIIDIHGKSSVLNLPLKGSTSLAHAKSSVSTRPKSNMNNAQSSSMVLPTAYQLNTSSSEENQHNNLSLEEIIGLGDESLGLKVVLTTKEEAYMGVISYILPASRRLALEKVCNPKTGKKYPGIKTIFFHSVLNISVIGENKKARQRLLKDVYHEDQRGKQLLMKKIVHPHMTKLHNETTEIDEDVLLGRVEQKSLSVANNISTEKEDAPPPPSKIPRPAKWIIIDTVGDAYKKALCFIRSENVIAMGMEGQNLGRCGTLAWISVATSTMIFLFDVAKIGVSETLKEGMGDIIQDITITKVVHDCRLMEDLLHHQFNVNLNNVFDTQAAEVYVYMLNHRGAVPSFVSSLPSLLIRYLGLSPHHLFFSRIREECAEDDESVWLERPLSPHLYESLARSVMYLRELRLELLDLILVDLAQVTQLYLGALRDKDSTTVKNLESHVVPAEVQKLGRCSVINNIGSHDPYISYSRDSVKINSQRKTTVGQRCQR